MRPGYLLAAVVVVLAGAGYWYFRDSGGAPANLLERTAVVERGDLVVSISASGVIQPVEQVEVKSKASGEIIELPVQEGDFVHKGDLVARLDPVTVKNDFDQAQADFNVAQATREQRETEKQRQQDLFDRHLVAKSELDNASLAYEESGAQLVRARAALATAQDRLDDTEIRSPIDGIVLSRPVEAGQIISSGTTAVTGGSLLCTIANMNRVYVAALVDETDIGRVKAGMSAGIRPEAYPKEVLEGQVLRVAPQARVEQNVTLFEVTCLVDNSNGLLKAGMNATVEIVMASALDVLTVPVRAVGSERPGGGAAHAQGGAVASERDTSAGAARALQGEGRSKGQGRHDSARWVQVRQAGTLEWKSVEVGLSNLDRIEVRSGLAEGDTVVYQLVSGAIQARDEFRSRAATRGPTGDMRRGGP
jgi:HlyD family secretion protein